MGAVATLPRAAQALHDRLYDDGTEVQQAVLHFGDRLARADAD